MPTFVQILDFIGTFAFAISGIRLASAKRFDWFGAYVVGFVSHRRRYDTRPAAGCDPRLDDRPHLSDMYRTGVAVGHLLRKASYPSAQYVLYIRHNRSGAVYGGGRGQEPCAGLSFLGGHHHGQHYRSGGRRDTRCLYQRDTAHIP